MPAAFSAPVKFDQKLWLYRLTECVLGEIGANEGGVDTIMDQQLAFVAALKEVCLTHSVKFAPELNLVRSFEVLISGRFYICEIFRLLSNIGTEGLLEIAREYERIPTGMLGAGLVALKHAPQVPTDNWVVCPGERESAPEEGGHLMTYVIHRDGDGAEVYLNSLGNGCTRGAYAMFLREK
ncbi:MAG: hypothetical protein PHS53_02230 [Candidatus Pacebacteria bacterium]|nr:hypothetical protein [Candidatus Paceibacterota bacterium]MDD5356943.1 hypothetical protein [Candidatus Paceibacterota bacterium]